MISLDEITIRSYLKPGDLGKVIEMHGRIYIKEMGFDTSFEFFVAKAIGELLNSNKDLHRYWVAEHADVMVGFISLMDHGDVAQLRFFVVDSEYRGIGLGRLLLEKFFDYYRSMHYSKCFLWTTHGLDQALHLYKSYGFKFVEEKQSTNFDIPLIELKYELITETI